MGKKSCDKDNRKLELTRREWSKHPTAVSHASIPTVNDSNNEKAQMEMKATLGLCCHQLGRMSVEWMRLIFLQVPGFKELQALLHRQAFLQTLVETEEEEAVRCWCSSVAGSSSRCR